MKDIIVAHDLDDVIVPGKKPLLNWLNGRLHTNYRLKDVWSEHLPTCLHIEEGKLSDLMSEYVESKECRRIVPFESAVYMIKQLNKFSKQIIVTNRSPGASDITEHQLKSIRKYLSNILYCGAEDLVNASIPKAEVCLEQKASLLIDDSVKNAFLCALSGIPVLVYTKNNTYPWTRTDIPLANVYKINQHKDAIKYIKRK